MAATAAPHSLIEARGLTKRFGDFTAVEGIDFLVGEALGFLGPNGAGKSSTMGSTRYPRSSGVTLRVLGRDAAVDGRPSGLHA